MVIPGLGEIVWFGASGSEGVSLGISLGCCFSGCGGCVDDDSGGPHKASSDLSVP